MITYISWTIIELGPITLQVWGLFVGLGFLVAAIVAAKYLKSRGGNPKIIYDLAALMLVTGLIGGRLGHVLFYDLPFYLDHPAEIFAIWHGGLSMMGGLLLSIIIGVWFLRKKKVDVWLYSDAAMFGLPVGLTIGRIGCFLIHDHPGTATDFILGVQYPDGVVRHDFGLYEVINAVAMVTVFIFLARRRPSPGVFLGIFSIWYGAFRLLTDGWRLNDARYLGLTPAQYLGLGLIVFGLVVLWIRRKRKLAQTATLPAEK